MNTKTIALAAASLTIAGCSVDEPPPYTPVAAGCSLSDLHCEDTCGDVCESESTSESPPEREPLVPDDELPLEAEVDPQADGPVFEGSEVWDKCCPVINGTIRDTGCFDDMNNSCSHLSQSTTWYIVNCNTCGTYSVNCSGTRWSAEGLFGAECLAFATRKYTNAIVDDNCNDNACVGASLGTWKAEAPPGDNPLLCVDPTDPDKVQTWRYDGAVNTLCCKAGSWDECIPKVGGNCGGTGAVGYEGYVYERWCSPCDGYSSTDGTRGAWDLGWDGSGGEWSHSYDCTNIYYTAMGNYPNAGDPAWHTGSAYGDIFATEYECGGYAFTSGGTLIHNNCP